MEVYSWEKQLETVYFPAATFDDGGYIPLFNIIHTSLFHEILI